MAKYDRNYVLTWGTYIGTMHRSMGMQGIQDYFELDSYCFSDIFPSMYSYALWFFFEEEIPPQ